jgi:hypothetical protein
VALRHLKRQDIYEQSFPVIDPRGLSLRSGFCALVPVYECREQSTLELRMRARLANGARYVKPVGAIPLLPGSDAIQRLAVNRATQGEPIVAICMPVFNPPLERFFQQFRALQRQSLAGWVCLVCDDGSRPRIFEQICRLAAEDPRFHVHQNAKHLGSYHNFERCLSMVPAGIEYVAWADPWPEAGRGGEGGAYWHRECLEALITRFAEGTTLVYGRDEDGRSRQRSADGMNRSKAGEDLTSLLLADTFSAAAAALFRQELLPYLLPFPESFGQPWPEHWIACTALALGRIDCADPPGVERGAWSEERVATRVSARTVTKWLRGFSPWRWRAQLREFATQARNAYFGNILRIQQFAQVLQLRCGRLVSLRKRPGLERLGRLDCAMFTALWLVARSLTAARRGIVSVTGEQQLLAGLWWRWFVPAVAWARSWRANRVASAATACEASPGASQPKPLADVLQVGMYWVEDLEQKMRPLALQPSSAAPRRVNLLIPNINFRYIFGGYLTKFHLARCLADSGYQVRMIFLDHCDYQPARWKQELEHYPGLEDLLDHVEVSYAYGRPVPIEMNPRDAIIATTWWTAHVASQSAQMLGGGRFIYLIQEYEPLTFPQGSWAALAEQTYSFPHLAVFSTEFLRDYFRQNRLGVFAESIEAGERDSFAFQNAITPVGTIDVRDIAGRAPRKLLFYARPEAHAVRNMFEMGVLALMRAVQDGCFANGWELYGIGTVETSGMVALGNGLSMHFLPRQKQEAYGAILRAHDLGLSLMCTPHPSLVPLEMASAGMLTVTNTYANKTAPQLQGISSNLIAVPATVDGIVQGLKQALLSIENYQARVDGARVKWATSWEEAFNRGVMARFEEFFEAVAGQAYSIAKAA